MKRHCGFCNGNTFDKDGNIIHAKDCTAPPNSRLAEPDSDAELKFRVTAGESDGIVGKAVSFASLNAGDMADIARTEAHLSRLLGVAVKIETAKE